MSVEVKMDSLPECSFCRETAGYDGKTKLGPWGYMCQAHYDQYGVGLGTGKGQRLVLRDGEEA